MLTDEQRKALSIAATNGYLSACERASIRELLAASAAPAEGREPQSEAVAQRIVSLFQKPPANELGPTDEPESQYRFGYNTAIEDVLIILESEDATAPTMSEAARDVLCERRRQVEVEGWTPEHDDEHGNGSLAMAAACYCEPRHRFHNEPPTDWPWDKAWWKPGNRRRELLKAGALILAEIERIDRAAAKGGSDEQ